MKTLKFLIAWPLAEAFFWIGHAASKYVYWWDERHKYDEVDEYEVSPLIFRIFWRVYQSCMAWSGEISDWGNAGVWVSPNEKVRINK